MWRLQLQGKGVEMLMGVHLCHISHAIMFPKRFDKLQQHLYDDFLFVAFYFSSIFRFSLRENADFLSKNEVSRSGT